MLMTAGLSNFASADIQPSVTASIFDGQHVPQSSLWAIRHADSLPAEQQLRFLESWLLPNHVNQDVRVTCDFVTPESVPQETLRDYSPKDFIVSPLIRLLDLSEEHDSLDRLATAVDNLRSSKGDGHLAANKAANTVAVDIVAALIALQARSTSDDQQTEAAQLISDSLKSFTKQPAGQEQNRDAVLIALATVCERPKLAAHISSSATMVESRYRPAQHQEAWHRHLYATLNKLRRSITVDDQQSAGEPIDQTIRSDQWHWVPRRTAETIGNGYPISSWRLNRGSAFCTQSNSDDALFFASPMSGDIQSQAKIFGAGMRRGHIRLAGDLWAAPAFDPNQVAVGQTDGSIQTIDLVPPFWDVANSQPVRYHTAIQKGELQTAFNGRIVHRQSIATADNLPLSPWVSLRSCFRANSGMENVRISGDIRVPDKILMITAKSLRDWNDYYSSRTNPNAWKATQTSEVGSLEIRSEQDHRLTNGSHAPRLLTYNRPVLEDGTIEFDYWYQPDRTLVHPVVGDHALLITDSSIAIHQITRGLSERRLIRSDNVQWVLRDATTPLARGQWNRMRIEFVGSTVTFYLNDQPIHELQSPADYRRRLGLFHYADQTQARVRHASWTGKWDKTIPPVQRQDLARIPAWLAVDESQRISQTLAYRFDANSIELGQLKITSGGGESTITPTDDGVTVVRPAVKAYREAKLALPVQLTGDFDITAGFKNLIVESETGKIGVIMLEADLGASDETNEDGFQTVMMQLRERHSGDSVGQLMTLKKIRGESARHYSPGTISLARSGKLRLSRRGATIYAFLAENDSQQFCLIGQSACSTADLPTDGIRLGSQIQGTSGKTTVQWIGVDIRSETLVARQLPSRVAQKRSLQQLNDERKRLTQSFHYDFKAGVPPSELFYFWNRNQSPGLEPTDDGLIIVSPGTRGYASAGLVFQPTVRGDFDITIEFDPAGLAKATNGTNSSVGLQIEPPGGMQLNSFAESTADAFATRAQQRLRLPTNPRSYDYLRLGTQTGIADQLRIAQRDQSIYLIAGNSKSDQQWIIAARNVETTSLTPGGIRMLVHTGDAEKTSRVLLKSLDIRATQPIPIPSEKEAVPALNNSPSMIQSLLDRFQP
ncbi:DUF1583 domain-containing protein [Planctomycetes bacterium K23_9]|uniref:Uncharacterized protein n=1 Tax=Stieleria marina TaxID=1930275 RepID=A0A517P0P4_9BACT|nr:hypothetical protein K239x_49490 [Planctomycetes bacterium K23_9]